MICDFVFTMIKDPVRGSFVFLAACRRAEIVAADFRAGLDGHGTLLLPWLDAAAARCSASLGGRLPRPLAVVAGLTVAFGHGALHFGLGRLLLSAFGLLLRPDAAVCRAVRASEPRSPSR